MRFAGIVLAAGEGRRMGRPKAELVVGGRTLLERHVARLEALGAAQIVVVARRPVTTRAELCVAATRSQAESLAVAAAALRAVDAVVVTPVDLVPPAEATYRALLSALTDDLRAITPTFRGHGGHPVVVRPEVLVAAYRRAAAPPPLNRVLGALGRDRLRLAVDDALVLGDLDTPADWRARVVTWGR